MEGFEEQLKRVEEKVQQLLKHYQTAQKEVERLHKENRRLHDELQQSANQANRLHQKVDSLKINALNVDDESKRDLEKRINAYLKEIDKCLSLLNN